MFSAEILGQYHACQEVDYSENIFKNSISAPFKSILRLFVCCSLQTYSNLQTSLFKITYYALPYKPLLFQVISSKKHSFAESTRFKTYPPH